MTRGARMPSLQEGLPPQLLESLMNLEPLEILVAEREEIHLQSWQGFCFSIVILVGSPKAEGGMLA